jgi:hypothetical protein
MGAEVKEYAWTSTSDRACRISEMIASVPPPLGEKKRRMEGPVTDSDVAATGNAQKIARRMSVTRTIGEGAR